MPEDTPRKDQRAAEAAPETQPQRPADSELRFSHLIRNMVVARDKARQTGG